MPTKSLQLVPDETIISKIHLLRGQKIMLDKDLAGLYGVTTGNLNKAVKRNLKRFPDDFMFQLTKEEFKNLIFQIGTSGWGGTRISENSAWECQHINLGRFEKLAITNCDTTI